MPWKWSAPRSLCLSHKVGLELEDGLLFDTVLVRISPPDYPLEGSLLASIFNPVFLKVGVDQKTRGWADFRGGGMAVFEDRFYAKSYFEFRAFESARAVDLLYALRLAATAGTSVTTMKELMTVIVAAENYMPRDARGSSRGPSEGLSDLIHCRNFQLHRDRVRSSCGRLWPESFMEFNDWIKEVALATMSFPAPRTPFFDISASLHCADSLQSGTSDSDRGWQRTLY
jgi:hypothetical protein